MADPITIGLILAGTGAGLQAVSSIRQGQIAEAQGKFARDIAVRNQQALERQAKAEQAAASVEESRVARREKIVKAQQRAIIGKSGIGLAGATLNLLADTAFQFSLERNLILRRGLIRSRELITRGGIIAAQGRFARTLGKQQRTAAFISAGGSILSAAGSFSQIGQTPSVGTPTFRSTGTQSLAFGGEFTRNFPRSSFGL